MKKINFIISSLFLLWTFNLLVAEEDVGRLADGRAYRIDNEGTQVVDYIAELELKIDELQSKIRSYENEARYSNQKTEFAEVDLISSDNKEKENCDCTEATSTCYAMLKESKLANESLHAKKEVVEDKVIALSKIQKEKNHVQKVTNIQPVASVLNQSPKRSSAMEHLRKKLIEDLKTLQKDIAKRDVLAKQYRESPKRQQLKVSMNSFQAGSDLSPSSIKQDLENARSFSLLGQIQKNILQVKKEVLADIKLLQRLLA